MKSERNCEGIVQQTYRLSQKLKKNLNTEIKNKYKNQDTLRQCGGNI